MDFSFEFLTNYVMQSINRGGKTYQENFLSNLTMKEQDESPSLVIKYTKEQINKNMKKDIDTKEKTFKYKGQAKWGE